MLKFIYPEELYTLLDERGGPLLLILINKMEPFINQQQILNELFSFYKNKIRIVLMDIEYQNSVTKKLAVHGFPAFIFCTERIKQAVLLGTPDYGILSEFVSNNLAIH